MKSLGILSKYPMFAVVQVERIRKEGMTKFGIRETQILETLCLTMSSWIHKIWVAQQWEKKEERVMSLLKTFREITMERNHVDIYNKILEFVPKLMNVEKAGLFMTDPENTNSMYNIANWK